LPFSCSAASVSSVEKLSLPTICRAYNTFRNT
jgi:hypothetical protein